MKTAYFELMAKEDETVKVLETLKWRLAQLNDNMLRETDDEAYDALEEIEEGLMEERHALRIEHDELTDKIRVIRKQVGNKQFLEWNNEWCQANPREQQQVTMISANTTSAAQKRMESIYSGY